VGDDDEVFGESEGLDVGEPLELFDSPALGDAPAPELGCREDDGDDADGRFDCLLLFHHRAAATKPPATSAIATTVMIAVRIGERCLRGFCRVGCLFIFQLFHGTIFLCVCLR
jgi:hypothetical protein